MTTSPVQRTADRVEALISSIDIYEPHLMGRHEDLFRVFARFISRSVDSRYLERHPPAELLPDLEHLFHATLVRKQDEVRVRLSLADGPTARRGVLITCLADQQFLYSAVRMALDHLGVKTYRTINSVVPIQRGDGGEITAVGLPDAPRESVIWVEIEADDLAERRTEIENYIAGRLAALRVIVADFSAMRKAVQDLATRFEEIAKDRPDHRRAYEDDARMLRWLLDEHFVLLGMRFLEASAYKGAAPKDMPRELGIGRFDDWRAIQLEDADKIVLETGELPPYLWIRKSRSASWLYRPGRTNHVIVQSYDDKGRPNGVYLIDGLFSFQALAEPRTEVPLLDSMIEELYTQMRATKGSHRYRSIRNAFNSLPLEYLFGLPVDDVRQLVERILEADTERRLQVHMTIDDVLNTAFVFVAMPRSHYDDELRADIRKLLKERLRAASIDDGVYAGDAESATFHYFLTGVGTFDAETEQALRAELQQLASPWTERLYDELRKRAGVAEARRLHSLYAEAFSGRYQEETSVARAVTDIEMLEAVGKDNPFDCDLYREKADEALQVTRLRLFESQSILLSNILPILDHFGLVVIDQFPTTVNVPGRSEQIVSTFRLNPSGEVQDLLQRRNRLRQAIRAVVAGAMDNDPLNRLLLQADIPWNYVALIRAYAHYARQIGIAHGEAAIRDILLRHADVTKALTELFRAKFDPDFEGLSPTEVDDKRLAVVDRTRRTLEALLEGVSDLTSDQVLRTFYNLIDATVRTNFYSRDEQRDFHIVLKFQPELISRMPEPRPYREILVHHPQVAGLHLRGGPVARGGIRWSDRPQDYRTEVLGLMATQNLKNVLIVPRGAKGAFILKHPPATPAERRAAADQMYRVFIGGLLDVTDNLVDGEKVTPPRVLRYDDKDHYLVVAADKGTAHLSDTANELALARDFWLGDAFASGGSKGYDHKKEAITARGGWECVKRVFKEMSVDPEKDRIRVTGIGDMSGDVFGNGMLLSKSMQLIAAFDHRHVFIDPTPDPEKSWEARRALFDKPNSSWEDYPAELLSAGGGIYPRRAKSIKLSPEARAALGASAETFSGPELVQAVLRAPVDLLWNGGIGTYIKASSESHIEVGDPTNDPVRVDATEVRAKVIGEGGNLGITQEGRIELASRGVRLDTDALHNSAGVDLSDHEVNLKILFQRPLAQGRMSRDQRDEMMERIRTEVNAGVLQNNWIQSRMVSLDELRSRRSIERFQRAINFLSERVPFRRRDMHFPGERVIAQRAARNEGLYRPELAILAACAKQDLRQELMKTEAITLDKIVSDLYAYFPPTVVEKFGDDVRNHPLGINIARTILTNRIIGDAGATWLAETALRTGRSTSDILEAYGWASSLIDAGAMKAAVTEQEGRLKTDLEYRARLLIEDGVEALCSWALRRTRTPTDKIREDVRAILGRIREFVGDDEAAQLTALAGELAGAGLDVDAAEKLAALPFVDHVINVAWVADLTNTEPSRALSALSLLGTQTGLLSLLRTPAARGGAEDGDSPAHFALRDKLRRHLVYFVSAAMRTNADLAHPSPRTAQVIEAMRREILPLGGGGMSLSALVMAADRIERNVDGLETV